MSSVAGKHDRRTTTTGSDPYEKHLAVPSMKRIGSLRRKPFFHNIRVQLNDQLKCLDGRLDTQLAIVGEFQDIFRRRAEIEAGYSRDLDKLSKLVSNRHREHKQKRESWQSFSSLQLWEVLVQQTKKSSRDHSALAGIYSSHLVPRLNQIGDDLQRIYRKCRDIGYEIHEEVLKVLHELHTAMKTLHTYQSEFRQAENKLQVVEKQRKKLEASVPMEKRQKHKKFRLIEKEYLKRKQKYEDSRLKATKARNEYLLYMDAANSSIQKYFVDDLSDLIDCMDFGFHQSVHRAVMMHSDGLDNVRKSLQQDVYGLEKSLNALDSRHDKQKFFEANNAAFMLPKKFEYNPVRRDETETLTQKPVLEELDARKVKLQERLVSLKAESEEIWKSMEMAEKSLSDVVSCRDWDTIRFFVEDDASAHKEPESVVQKEKDKRVEVEDFYVSKFREYVLNSNRIARLQAKYDNIRATLGDQSSQPVEGLLLTLTRRPNAGRRRRIGKSRRQGAPKLFGGSLEEYLEDTNVDIPPVVKSCVRLINRFGLHHHGIFRKSGSQIEIANFRDSFERGEDPLADVTDASDINSVAGVLKLYLRELREPLFPIQYFDHFMELSQLHSKHEFVVKVRDLIKSWPRAIFIVMRYLFAFLNHLSEFSDENMMDPYNLAICFGPTLVPIPEERDQVQYQNLVNELIKNVIIFHEDIFPVNVAGTAYEKYLTQEPDDMGDSPADQSQDDLDSEMTEDDSVFKEDGDERDDLDQDLSIDLFGKSDRVLHAQALYDFNARSSREVNFRKGETIMLERQVSNDWWKGSASGKTGLIPDKYIMLKIRGEDDRESDAGPRARSNSTSCEERRRSRGSSSSETTVNVTSGKLSHSSPTPTRNSTSSPASQRISRSSIASTRSSPTSTGGAAKVASTTVLPVVASGKQKDSEALSSMREEAADDDLINDKDIEQMLERTEPPSSSVVGNTHIIRVSGPVTNLDEAAAASSKEAGHPRSRLPLTPSMEACLKESYGGSQDSLLSTGSNQELKTQLDSTIARVDAITTVIEQQTATGADFQAPSKPKRSSNAASLNGNETGARFRQPAATRRLSVEGAAPSSKTLPRCSQQSDPKPPDKRGSGVMLKTSSWASRDVLKLPTAGGNGDEEEEDVTVESGIARRNSNVTIGGGKEEEEEKPFAKARDLWERRTSFQGSGCASKTARDPDEGSDCPPPTTKAEGFRSNKDFWEQRVTVRQKQTPDLVMDLPLSTSPKGGGGSGNSSVVVVPVAPQPRPRKTSASCPQEEDVPPPPISKEKDSGQTPVALLRSPPKARARKSLGHGVKDEQDVSMTAAASRK